MARLHFKSAFVDIFFLAGLALLLLLIVLSGSSKNPSYPLNHFYWVQAPTQNVTGAPKVSRWTYWGVCETVGLELKNCVDSGPAVPISPADNFNTQTGIPEYFLNNSDTFYYLSRVGWSALLISLVFTVISLFTAFFSIYSFHLQKVTALFSFIAAIFQFASAALYTAAIALFKAHWHGSKIGPTLMGFLWALAVCNLIVLATTFGACARESYLRAKERHAQANIFTDKKSDVEASPVVPAPAPAPAPGPVPAAPVQQFDDPYAIPDNETQGKSGGINFFKIKRNRREEESDL